MTKPKLDELVPLKKAAREVKVRFDKVKEYIEEGKINAWGKPPRLRIRVRDLEDVILQETAYIPEKFKQESPRPERQRRRRLVHPKVKF